MQTVTAENIGGLSAEDFYQLAFLNRGAFTVNQFCLWANIGRSKFYEEVKAGRIKLRKVGKKSVVITPDAISYIQSLPIAE
jgi:hypothetical protein